MDDVVLVSAVRTPHGAFGGTLRDLKTVDLGVAVLTQALKRAGVQGGQVDEAIVAHCRQAGNGVNPSRQVTLRAGLPIRVPAHTVNQACVSGIKAIILAAQAVLLEQAEVVAVVGMESMSTIPYLLRRGRWSGLRMGDVPLEDGWNDGAIDPVCGLSMGQTAERLVEKYGIPRQEQDEFALESHQKAALAWEKGWFQEEVIPVEVSQPKKEPFFFTKDETIRADTSLEKLASLRPVFKEGGTVTAGNSCGLSDGASAVVVMSRRLAEELKLVPLASLVSAHIVGVEPSEMGEGPAMATPVALTKAGLSLDQIDLIEVNEAFAAQVLANERLLKWDRSKVNQQGGAIALGHPTGHTGVRIVVTLTAALRRRGGGYGLATLCGGGGLGAALILKVG